MTYQLNSDTPAHGTGMLQSSIVARIVGTLKRKFVSGLAHYRQHRQARIDRAAFQQMLSLDDDILDDIGVTRSNVEWANQLPLNESAALALDKTKTRARPKIRP